MPGSFATSFDRIHLRWNPFGELDPDERAALACVELGDHGEFLRVERRVLQLVADHGRGKSTLLLALHRRDFAGSRYTQLHEGDPAPEMGTGVGAHPVDFVDSIENLGFWARRRMYRRVRSLACTTHRDLSREMRRAGLTVRTVRVGIEGLADLERIAAGRIRYARTWTGEPPALPPPRLAELYAEYGDDVRGIEYQLYLDYQRLKENHGQVQPQH